MQDQRFDNFPTTDARKAMSEAKHRANVENAQHSTGPKTPEGKRRSSLNGMRSKLHCQISALPAEDLAVYNNMMEELVAELQPVGPQEKFYAVSMAQSMWRLNHAMGLMQGIFAAGHMEKIHSIDTGNEEVDNAVAAAKTFIELNRELANLTTYEGRIRRALEKDRAALKELQTERKAKYDKALQQAADFAVLALHRGETYEPGDDFTPASDWGGFAFSPDEIVRYYNREQRLKDAQYYKIQGEERRPRPKNHPKTDLAA